MMGGGGSSPWAARYVSRYVAVSSSTRCHGFCGTTSTPVPSLAMISADSGEMVAEYVRPLNDLNGAGWSSMRGWWTYSPSYSITTVSRAVSTASADSLNC